MKTINEILKDYNTGEADLEDTNAALAEVGAGYHLEPGRNTLTEQNMMATTVGYYPEQANGWGLMDTGTGTLDKVHVLDGKLDYAVNEVMENGSVNMEAMVTICGRTYRVLGDKLANVPEETCDACKVPPLPLKADLSRRMDLAEQTVEQNTKSGTYLVRYNESGYAVEARKKEVI